MTKFRKLPVVIEAVQFQNKIDCPPWLGDAIKKHPMEVGGVFRVGNELHIFTLEGTMIAQFGDWIIKGINGKLYPCKPDIFSKTYEPVAAIPLFTTGHCENNKRAGGCQLHNLQCGYPKCDQRPTT